MKLVAKMLNVIHVWENKKVAREKAKAVAEELRAMKLKEAARKVEDGNRYIDLRPSYKTISKRLCWKYPSA